MKWIVLALALTFMPLSALAEPLSAAGALAIRDKANGASFTASGEWTALTYYLQGAIEASVMGAQASGAFCPPTGASYGLAEIFAAFERLPKAERNQPAARVIPQVLAQRYPCED